MTPAVRKELDIPDSHIVELEKTERIQKRGQDSDVCFYVQKDKNGVVVGRFKVTEYMSIYPLFAQRTIIDRM